MDKYRIPNFKYLQPTNIIASSEEVKKSKYYDAAIEPKPSKDKFNLALMKLSNNEKLYSLEYKTLLFYLSEIEKQGLLEKLYKSYWQDISTFRNYRGFLRPLLSYLYNYYEDDDNGPKIYRLLEIIIPKLKESKKYESIKHISSKNSDYNSFLLDIKQQFYNITDEKEIEVILKKVFMSKSDQFYLKCMVTFIVKNHLDQQYIEEFKNAVNRMDLETKKELYTEILKIYAIENDIDKYPKVWFAMILEDLGEPYSSVNTKWNGIAENLKETFRRWNNSENIYNFFLNEATEGDQRRLNFWRQYIDSIYRIRYYRDANKALVMEFKNHLFIEFAQHSNALYYYDKKVKNIDMIDVRIKEMSKKESIDYLKDIFLGDRKNHRGTWEYDFEKLLKSVNYNKGGW